MKLERHVHINERMTNLIMIPVYQKHVISDLHIQRNYPPFQETRNVLYLTLFVHYVD